MEIKGVDKIAKASQSIVQKDMGTWLGVWYDFKTHTLYTTEEQSKLDDKSHAYVIGKMIRPNTEAEVMQMMKRWMHW